MILSYHTFMNSQSEKIACFFIFIHSFFNIIFNFLCFVFSIFSYLSFILVVTAQLPPEIDNQNFEEFFKMETDELEEITKVNHLINDSKTFDDIVNLKNECSMFNDSIFFDDLVEIEEQSMINFYFDLDFIWSYVLFIILKVVCTFFQKLYKHCNSC